MRNIKTFFNDIVRKPPILFPLVAAAHIFWLLILLWSDRHEPFPDFVWLQVLWMVGYTTFWIAACDLRKWGAIGYILLTVTDAAVYFAVIKQKLPDWYLSNIFLIDGLLSFFLVFYYKRLTR